MLAQVVYEERRLKEHTKIDQGPGYFVVKDYLNIMLRNNQQFKVFFFEWNRESKDVSVIRRTIDLVKGDHGNGFYRLNCIESSVDHDIVNKAIRATYGDTITLILCTDTTHISIFEKYFDLVSRRETTLSNLFLSLQMEPRTEVTGQTGDVLILVFHDGETVYIVRDKNNAVPVR